MLLKKLFLLGIIVITGLQSSSQYNKRPTKSRFISNKFASFNLSKGDTLVYSIDNNKDSAGFKIIQVQVNGSMEGEWLPDSSANHANTSIPVKNYWLNTTPDTINIHYHEALVNRLWLPTQKLADLVAAKQTIMNGGNGLETFSIIHTSTYHFPVKNVQSIVTVFTVSNQNKQKPITFDVLTDPLNPLIIRQAWPYQLELKAVR